MAVYSVVPENDPSLKPRNLHRNLLLPCDELPLENEPLQNKNANKPTEQIKRSHNPDTKESMVNSNDSDDSDDEILVLLPTENRLDVQGSSNENREVLEEIPENITENEFDENTGDNSENNENVSECSNQPENLRTRTPESLELDPPIASPSSAQRPRRQRRPPEYLQYQSPIVSSISTPMYIWSYNGTNDISANRDRILPLNLSLWIHKYFLSYYISLLIVLLRNDSIFCKKKRMQGPASLLLSRVHIPSYRYAMEWNEHTYIHLYIPVRWL